MNGMQSGALSAIILITLFIFGWRFDHYVARLGADADGFVWLLVVAGTTVTLVGIGLLDLLLDWNAGLIGLAAFAASGFFMSYGAVQRYIRMRHRMMDQAKHDAAQTLAE